MGLYPPVHVGSLGAVGSRVFRLLNHSSGQQIGITSGHKLSDPADFPSFRNAVQFRGDDRASAGVGLKDHGGERLGSNLGMNQDVESVIKGNRITLLPDQPCPV